MSEDLIKALDGEMREAVLKKESPEDKIKSLTELQKKIQLKTKVDEEQKKRLFASIYEVIGNMHMRLKNPSEAEKVYRSMFNCAADLYKADAGKYDLLYAQTCLRMGMFYKDLLRIREVVPQPYKLNENQQKVFDLSEKILRNGIKLALEKIKAGNQTAIELQAKCMNHLMVLKGATGAYQESAKIGEQLIRVGKALFQAFDDAGHALELAQYMGNLSIVYLVQKEYIKAMEILEDCIFVLKDKERDNPVIFSLRLASSYLNLGNACFMIPEEIENAEDYYKKGIAEFEKLNKNTGNKLENQLKQAYAVIANYYDKTGKDKEADHYRSLAGIEKTK